MTKVILSTLTTVVVVFCYTRYRMATTPNRSRQQQIRTHRSCRRRPGPVGREAKPVQHPVLARRRTSKTITSSLPYSFGICARRQFSTTTRAAGRRAMTRRAKRGCWCWTNIGLGFRSSQRYAAGCADTSSACGCCCYMTSAGPGSASRPRQPHHTHGRKLLLLRMLSAELLEARRATYTILGSMYSKIMQHRL